MSAKYISLKTIVSFFLDETGKSGGDFDTAWLLAFRAMDKLGYQISDEPKTVRLPVGGNKTVPFPSDYRRWIKIGLLNDTGEVTTLRINNALTTFKDVNPNRLNQINGDVNNSIAFLTANPFFLNYFYNGNYMPLFGVGGGLIQYGECRVDETNNVIVLPPDFSYNSIILEYMSCPQQDGDYQILDTLKEAVIAFIKWKMKLGQREEFYAEMIEARRTLPGKRVTLQTINQVLRESNGFKLLA
jgi:hypothetical protein